MQGALQIAHNRLADCGGAIALALDNDGLVITGEQKIDAMITLGQRSLYYVASSRNRSATHRSNATGVKRRTASRSAGSANINCRRWSFVTCAGRPLPASRLGS